MEIRRAAEEDLPGIQLLLTRNFDEIMSHFHSGAVLDHFKKLNSIESLSNQLLWKKIYIATDDNEIIGTGSFVDFGTKESPKYSVSNLFVTPELHRRGIGKKLILRILEEAAENHAVELHVPSSRNGIRFYEKMGFQVNADQPDVKDEITWMTLKLDIA